MISSLLWLEAKTPSKYSLNYIKRRNILSFPGLISDFMLIFNRGARTVGEEEGEGEDEDEDEGEENRGTV